MQSGRLSRLNYPIEILQITIVDGKTTTYMQVVRLPPTCIKFNVKMTQIIRKDNDLRQIYNWWFSEKSLIFWGICAQIFCCPNEFKFWVTKSSPNLHVVWPGWRQREVQFLISETVDRTGIANLNHCSKHRKQITLLSVTQKQERKFTMAEDRRTKARASTLV